MYSVYTEAVGNILSHVAIHFKGLREELGSSIIIVLWWSRMLYECRSYKCEYKCYQGLVYICLLAVIILLSSLPE